MGHGSRVTYLPQPTVASRLEAVCPLVPSAHLANRCLFHSGPVFSWLSLGPGYQVAYAGCPFKDATRNWWVHVLPKEVP